MNQRSGKQITILLIEQDDETRPLLKQNLHTLGYAVADELDEIGAIERVRGSQTKPHLILINQIQQPTDAAVNMGRRIRREAGLPENTPIVVYVDDFEPELQGQDIQVGDHEYITYPEDGEQLFNLISRLISIPDQA